MFSTKPGLTRHCVGVMRSKYDISCANVRRNILPDPPMSSIARAAPTDARDGLRGDEPRRALRRTLLVAREEARAEGKPREVRTRARKCAAAKRAAVVSVVASTRVRKQHRQTC